tara:strand:- start:764 stop:1069 length:306 start_codon:yes stop_codon:yes gene_type:complete
MAKIFKTTKTVHLVCLVAHHRAQQQFYLPGSCHLKVEPDKVRLAVNRPFGNLSSAAHFPPGPTGREAAHEIVQSLLVIKFYFFTILAESLYLSKIPQIVNS